MSQSKNFISVFPLTFFSDKIEIDNNYKKKLVSLILDDEKKSTKKKPNDSWSWTGDVYGNEYLHNHKHFIDLFNKFSKKIIIYCNGLGYDSNKFNFYYLRSWATISRNKERIKTHSHRQSHISFAYYLQLPENSGGLTIHNTTYQNQLIAGYDGYNFNRTELIKMNPLNTTAMNLHAEESGIIIFPSKTEHSTLVGTNEKPRISISADVVLTLKEEIKNTETGLTDITKWKKF